VGIGGRALLTRYDWERGNKGKEMEREGIILEIGNPSHLARVVPPLACCILQPSRVPLHLAPSPLLMRVNIWGREGSHLQLVIVTLNEQESQVGRVEI
jgi:hypothetical protein